MFPRVLDDRRLLKLLEKDGWVKFKTDNTSLFDYTLELFEEKVKVKNLEYTHDLR